MVKNILDLSSYYSGNIALKHVIDNSCGDGAFLIEIVARYCADRTASGVPVNVLKQELETYIHGIEIDKNECEKCKKRLDAVSQTFLIDNVKWDIKNADTLQLFGYNNKMDFVIGNPPYVRVHNLCSNMSNVKKYMFTQTGMTDLYIAFYEVGLRMLNATGILGYITPSSFFSSVAGYDMRKYFMANNLLCKVVDLKHFQPFSATTYTAIVVLNKAKLDKCVDYYKFDEQNLIPYYFDTFSNNEFYISGSFFFGEKRELKLLTRICQNLGHCDVSVKNGYATLCDDVFINRFDFNSNYVIPVIKASRGIEKSMIYPYDRNSKAIAEDELKKDKSLYKYLVKNKGKLLKRSCEKDKCWYAFGRSQAINDTYKDKLAIGNLLRNKTDIKAVEAPAGTGVYSGLYLTSKKHTVEELKQLVQTDEFAAYVALLGKYKSGGFYTFSSKDIKLYLDYKLAYEGGLMGE